VRAEFLELSLDCSNVLESLRFWERIGFVSIPVGDIWLHRYGVVTDGRLCLGLHDYRFPSPSLSFVAPGLASQVETMAAQGIEFAFSKLATDEFHEAGFTDPAGHMVCLLEARTFSPATLTEADFSLAGYFRAYRIPTRNAAACADFWENLGLLRNPEFEGPGEEVCGTGLNLRFTSGGGGPELLYEVEDLEAFGARLQVEGFAPHQEGETLRVAAPDGLLLRLTEARA
jgi:hypothetical protein